MVDFFTGRKHCTKTKGVVSPALSINASVVQGSALGPVAFILNATDLHCITKTNILKKYADDTYLIVPSINSSSIPAEMASIANWAKDNNLKLNSNKSLEMIVRRPNAPLVTIPPPIPGIKRVTSLTILGVTVQDTLSMSNHIASLVSSAGQNLYALKTLKVHGLHSKLLSDVCRSTLVSRLTYAAPAWWGFTTANDRIQLESVLKKAKRWQLCNSNAPTITDIVDNADSTLFKKILSNPDHVLHPLLPPTKPTTYNLRSRAHNRQLPTNTNSLSKNFIHRMLYQNIY